MENMIQVAGISSLAEAEMIVACGATHIGFPLRLAYHQEDVSEFEAATIISRVAGRIKKVLITYLNQGDEIVALVQPLAVEVVQLHADIDIAQLKSLKATMPGLKIIKSLIVGMDTEQQLLRTVTKYSPYVDYFITDTFDPTTGATGATGKVHDWQISKRIVELSPRPVILAGGLNCANVRAAIVAVQPAGVDTHTGVERADGSKDRALVQQFVNEALAGFAAIRS
jgi:phosphoribosylanthranilate isomerase